MAEFAVGTRFRRVLDDPRGLDPQGVRRVVLTYGKLGVELLELAKTRGIRDVAIVRLEQLYPLAWDELESLKDRYRFAGEWVLAQEEPQNLGAFHYLWIELFQKGWIQSSSLRWLYVGRARRAAPATGFSWYHEAEQKSLWDAALGHQGQPILTMLKEAHT